MEKQEIVLKKSRLKLIVRVVISGLIAVGFIIEGIMWEDQDAQWMIILGGLVSLIACIYFTKEWLDHKIEMVISTEGVRLRGEGFYSWSSIEKFSTDEDEGNVTLILFVRDQAAVHFGIASLEMKKKELIELIIKYGQPAGLYYTKHY